MHSPEQAFPDQSSSAALPADVPIEIVRASSTTPVHRLAGAIASKVRQDGRLIVQTIGASATNQAVKAIAMARDFLQADGIDICFVPFFVDVEVEGEVRSALQFLVLQRPPAATNGPDA
jgi:stage V sporulation protein S